MLLHSGGHVTALNGQPGHVSSSNETRFFPAASRTLIVNLASNVWHFGESSTFYRS